MIWQVHGLILFERSSSLPGSRVLEPGIGVPPPMFDDVTTRLKQVGEVASLHVDKIDKTNDYKEASVP